MLDDYCKNPVLLEGGLTSAVYQCYDESLTIFKIYPHLYQMLREKEILEKISFLGVGPKVLAIYPECQALRISYVEGEVLKPFSNETLAGYQQAVQALRKVHLAFTTPKERASFPFLQIHNLWNHIHEKKLPLPSPFYRAWKIFVKIEHLLKNTKVTLCHGDFHRKNVLITQEEAKIIDWAYATVGHPLADLEKILLDLNKSKKNSLLATYFGHEPTLKESSEYTLISKVMLFYISLMRYSLTEGTTKENLPPFQGDFSYPSPKKRLKSSLKILSLFLEETNKAEFQQLFDLYAHMD